MLPLLTHQYPNKPTTVVRSSRNHSVFLYQASIEEKANAFHGFQSHASADAMNPGNRIFALVACLFLN